MHDGKVRVGLDAIRFVLAGLANTAFTTFVYFGCLTVTTPPVAYSLAWLCGIVFVFFVYPTKVFKGGNNGLGSRLAIVAVNVVVFALGLALLNELNDVMASKLWPFTITLVVTTICNFFFGRLVARRQA